MSTRAHRYRESHIKKLDDLAQIADKAFSTQDVSEQSHCLKLGAIAETDETTFDREDRISREFDKKYYAIKSIFYQISAPVSTSNQDEISSNVFLPKIQLSTFSGDITTFSSFIDVFDSLIERNTKLSDIEKFNYLLSTLRGPALALVKNLPMTAANYKIAYDTLTKRYKNTRLVAAAHWSAIENTTKVSSDDPKEVRPLLDIFSDNLAALKQLNFPIDAWDFILVQMLLKRISVSLATRFELSHNSTQSPAYKQLYHFLSQHCTALENLNVLHKVKQIRKTEFQKQTSGRTTTFLTQNTSSNNKCVLCQSDHLIYRCPDFTAKSPHGRYQIAKNLKLCINCLSNTHIRNCKSSTSCRRCGLRHHTLLHFEKRSSTPVAHNVTTSDVSSSHDTNAPASISNQNNSIQSGFSSNRTRVLLSTARVQAFDKHGNIQPVRCLLDSGSMTSFITQKCIRRLGLFPNKRSLHINGLGPMSTLTNQGEVTLSVCPTTNHFNTLNVDAVVLNKICDNLPTCQIPKVWSHLSNLTLADPKYDTPGNIDLSLGADVFSKILLDGKILGADGAPDAINTIFGYVLMGKFNSPMPVSSPVSLFCSTSCVRSLEESVKKFWETESVPEVHSISPEDQACELHFQTTHQRDPTGRFVVHYPFRNTNPKFPGIRSLALSRFNSLENRLLKNPVVYDQYKAFMKEYVDLGHMEPVEPPSNLLSTYYIPHHSVIRPDSLTTKLRVVFNGSAKLPNQSSLNENLFVGPKLQNDLCIILLNFRLHPYVLTANIKMMYRQILASPDQRDYQRILWRFSPSEKIQDYRLNTVTYGLASSPFLAIRTLSQLAEDEKQHFPIAADVIKNNTFVDDVCFGGSSFEQAIEIQTQLIAMLNRGGFELRKWSSNNPILLQHLPPSFLGIDLLTFDSSSEISHKVLGLQWIPSSDNFKFSVQISNTQCTKRNMLSNVARIFDPFGFLSPLTFLMKHLIQRIWMNKVNWDDPPSSDIIRIWDRYLSESNYLSELTIPRLIRPEEFTSCEIHCFGDASEKGYCAVLYFVFFSESHNYTSYLVCAKSKVAPLKKISLPKLELCAAVLASRLVSFVSQAYSGKLTFSRICCWTDSTVALCWIQSPPYRWKTFVSNRVAFIQEKVHPTCWFHVSSSDNPADFGSRGLLPKDLLHCSAWWAGPAFLRSSIQYSSGICPLSSDEALQEERKLTLTTILSPNDPNFLDSLLTKHSFLNKSLRILSYIRRFINGLRRNKPSPSWITSVELNESLITFVKHTQSLHFVEEISSIKGNKPLPKVLKKLSPFIDENQLLRVGGRLRHAPISYNRKYPALLPSRSRLTDLIIEYIHLKYFHAGVQTVQYLIAQQFWILSFKRSIRRVLSRCVKCFHVHPFAPQPPMGDLPVSRLSRLKPFLHAGVDYAGPFTITMSKSRWAKTTKAYLCLFICFATKSIHLELASDLSSDAFLAALRRFLARRGRCECLYSDRGTNFVGAYRQLNEYLQSSASQEAIQWKWIPSAAPNFGGLWEAGVKSVKSHLIRVVGDQVLTYEELLTVFVQIEALLNSRPLTPISNDPNDLNALTPGHFLTMNPLTAPPEPDLTNLSINRLTRWQLLTRLHQDFWKRWSLEYLHTLHQRSKLYDVSSPPIKKGTLVRSDTSMQ